MLASFGMRISHLIGHSPDAKYPMEVTVSILQATNEAVIFLRGNHVERRMDSLQDEKRVNSAAFGDDSTLIG